MSSKRIGIILDVDAEVSKAKGNIGSLSKVFEGIGGKQGNQLRSILADINTEYSKLADESGKAMSKIGDFSKAEKSLQKLDQLFGKLEKELGNIDKMSDSDLSKLFPPEVADRIKKASEAIKTYNTYVEESSKIKGAIGQATKQYEDQEKAVKKAAQALKELEDIQRGASKKQVVSADTKVLKANEVKAAVAELNQYEKELVEAQSKMDEFKKRKADLFTRGTQNKSSEFRQLNQELDAAEKNFNEATTKAAELKRELKNMVIQGDLDNEIKDAEKALEDAQTEAKELKKNLEDIRTEEMAKAFDQAKDKLKELANIDLDNFVKIDDIIDLFKRFQQDGIEGVTEGINKMKSESKELGEVTKEMGNKVEVANKEFKQQNEILSEVQGIKTRITEFFKLDNAIQLARQGIRKTIETVKELDKAMTETAVVTDFSVGDMWDALPRYTKVAKELGTTTLGAYETMTLFYQQGLDTNEVFEVGTETMKMARIAGLDYAEATDLMTAALRGFNMELNEASAKRVNDVYSELAAITAADTEEIATAMTKTASIAKSANMEFETTAAFLSKIIETTREPAETAGTAMKTIIARFTEMKKATSDVINFEGEEIYVNKVEEALRSAGVALRDVNGEFRDADDVFLELAGKWDNLDIMTQRYIATMAAGSRQQSRFLAIMQDYDRTIELIDAAYNSSGASAAQFAKTQESLESKLNRLKDAWDEFLMGIADSKLIKGVVDLLTGLLEVVNKLTGNSGLAKLGVALGALFGGKIISNKLFGGVKESIITSLLKPLGDAGVLADGVASKLSGLGKGSWWKQMTGGMTGFKTAISSAASSLASILPVLIAIAAVAAAIAAIHYFSDEQVATRQLKQAEKEAASLAEGLDDARKAVQAIGDDRSGLQALKDDLADLVVGTDEWKQKLLEVQLEEQKLIQKYNLKDTMIDPYTNEEQTGLIKTNENGSQSITSKGWDYIEKRQNDAVSRGLLASSVANARAEEQEFLTNQAITLEQTADREAGIVDEMAGVVVGLAAFGAMLAGIAAAPISGGTSLVLAGAAAVSALGIKTAVEEYAEDDIGKESVGYKEAKTDLEQEQELAENQTKISYKNAFKSDISRNEDYNDLSSDEIEAISSMQVSQLDSLIDDKRAKIGEELSDADVEKWAVEKGYTYKEGKVYDIDGVEVGTSDRKTMANDLAIYQATSELASKTSTFGEYLDKGGNALKNAFKDNDTVFSEDFSKILNGDVSTNEALVNSLMNDTTQIDSIATSFIDSFGEDTAAATAALAAFTGKTVNDITAGGDLTKQLSSFLNDQVAQTQANQEQTKIDFYEEMAKSGVITGTGTVTGSDGNSGVKDEGGKTAQAFLFSELFNAENAFGTFGKNAQGVASETTGIFDQLDAAQRQSIVNISSSLRESLGKEGAGSQKLFENLSGMNFDEVKTTISYFEGVDFSNPIQGAAAFRDALNDIAADDERDVGDKIDPDHKIKGLVEDLQGLSENEYDLGSQFQFLQTSESFQNLSEPISKLIEENGKLTADNILELAGASDDLATFLENDKITADGLAAALTIVETSGGSAMKGLTTATLAAISSTKTLSTHYEEMIASIESFEPAIDTMAGADFNNDALSKIKEFIASGEYGNNQLHSYLDYYFKEGSASKAEDIDKQVKQLEKWNKDEGRGFWSEAKGTLGSLGSGTGEKINVATTFKTGGLSSISVDEAATTDDILNQLQEKFGITKEAATNYLAVLTSHSLDLKELLEKNDAGKAIETLISERAAQTGTESILAFGEEELKVLAEKYGMTIEDLKLKIQEAAGTETEITFAPSFVDKNGRPLTGQTLIDTLNTKTEGSENSVLQDIVVTTKVTDENGNEVEAIDYLETKELMLDVGLNEEQATTAINQFLKNNTTENGEKYRIEANGKILPEDATAEEANNWANSVVNQIDESTLQTFAQSLANLDYTAAGAKIVSDVKTEVEKATFTVNLTPNTANLKSKIQASVNSDGTGSSGTWYVAFYKDGSDGIPKDQVGMTGEEGTELIQSKDGTARLVGTNGPELTSLKKGDVIYTAEETKKILKGKTTSKTFPAYAKGTNNKTSVNNVSGTLNGQKPTTIDLVVNIDAKLENEDRRYKNGEIDAGTYQKNQEKLLTQKWYALQKEFNNELSTNPQKKYIYYDAKDDQVKLKSSYNSLDKKTQEEVKREYDKIKAINDELNKIEDELSDIPAGNVGSKVTSGTNDNNKNNNDARMEALERQYQKGAISAIDYQDQKKGLLKDRQSILQSELNKELSSNPQKSYFKYDKTLDTIILNTEKFNKLTKEKQEEVLKEYEKVKGINDELNGVEDELAKIPGTVTNATTNNTTNEDARLQDADRQRALGNISAADYDKKKEEQLSKKQTKLQNELNSNLKKDKDSQYFNYNKKKGTFTLNEEEFSKLSKEQQDKIQSKYDSYKKQVDDINAIKDERAELKKKDKYDTTNQDAELEKLQRQYEKGEIGVETYNTKKNAALKTKQTKLNSKLTEELANDVDKDYFVRNEKTGTIKLKNAEFKKLSKEQQDVVREKYNKYKGYQDELNAVSDELAGKGKKRNNDVTNENAKLESLDRRLANGSISAADYDKERKAILQEKETKLRNELNDQISSSANKDMYVYNDVTGELLLNQEKLAGLSEELQDQVKQEYETLKGINDEANGIKDTLAEANHLYGTGNEDASVKYLEMKKANGELSAADFQKAMAAQEQSLAAKAEANYGSLKEQYKAEFEAGLLYEDENGLVKIDETLAAGLGDEAYADLEKKQSDMNNEKFAQYQNEQSAEERLTPGNQYDTTNMDTKMENLSRDFSKGNISAYQHDTQQKAQQLAKKENLKNDFTTQLNNSANYKDGMYTYDESTGEFLLNMTEFNKLSKEAQEEVKQEYETLKGINDQVNEIEDNLEAGQKYMRYNDSNQDATRQNLDWQYENGYMDPKTYQTAVVQNNTQTSNLAQGTMDQVVEDISASVGGAILDTNTGKFSLNSMASKELLNNEDFKKWFSEMEAGWNEISQMKDGKEKDAKLEQWLKDYNAGAAKGYTGNYYKNGQGVLMLDQVNWDFLTDKTTKDTLVQNQNDYNEALTTQQQSQHENDKNFTAREEQYRHENVNAEQDLAKLEQDFKDGKISFDDYMSKKQKYLRQQQDNNTKDFNHTYDNSAYKQYIEVAKDDQGNVVSVSVKPNSGFEELSDDLQTDIKEEIGVLDEILESNQGIEDYFDSPDWADERNRKKYQKAEMDDFNAQADQNYLGRKKDELAQYNTLIGKLPSEIQGPLNLLTGAIGMLYTADQSQILRRQEANAQNQFDAQWADAEAKGYASKDGASGYITQDEFTGEVVFDLAAANKARDEGKLTPEEYELLKQTATDLSSAKGKVLDIQQQRSGGIFQKPFYTAEKAAKAMSKAFKKTGKISDNVKEAFRELEKELGLTEGALSNFESAFTKLIDSLDLEDKTFGGLNKPELLEQIKKSKFGEYMSEDMTNWLGMIFGEEAVDGNTFWETGLSAIGDGFGRLGDFMNFEMIGQGLDMANTAKGIVDQIKSKIEEIIGYITQATQVLVDAWTGREDYLYNFLKQIEKHLQDFADLQRYSTQLEKGRLSSSQDILDNWNAQWESLQLQLEEQTERLETRQRELDRSRWNPFSLISGWDPTSDTLYENREVKMLWDIIIGLGEAFAPLGTGQFFSQLNQLYEDYDQRVQQSYEDRLAAEQALLDIEDERLELVKIGSDEATQFEEKVLEALLQKEQEAIDELTRLNDSVTEANSKLLSTLQSNLDKIRQDRENEKKEEELGEKERRLAYLRQDTSGANSQEIKKLEKELDEQHEDYTDTLIDQKISELEKQNELAAEQRQKQIDLLQGQLEYAEKYGLYWDAIYGMLYTIDENGKAVLNSDNFDLDGNIRENSELAKMLGTFSDRMSMSTWSQVLDNEDTKRLGRYYGAFIGMNGVDGNWANYWALLNPGANDPNYSYPEQEIPDGLWGVLYKLEIGIKKYFGNSNLGLVNGAGRIEESFKNFFGKMFGYDEWANYDFTGFNPAHVESTVFSGIKNTTDDIKAWFASGFDNLTKGIKSGTNIGGTQNYGAVTENYNFNIGTVGESISLNEMIDKVTSAIKGLFTPNGVAYADKGH